MIENIDLATYPSEPVVPTNKYLPYLYGAMLFFGGIAIGFVVGNYRGSSNTQNQTPTPTVIVKATTTPTEMPTITTSSSATPSPTNALPKFTNSKMSIELQPGWTASNLSNGAVNIKKGSYILYINPDFAQTSGAQGGKLDEISSGSPSADLVTVAKPAIECTTPAEAINTGSYKRIDLYVDSNVDPEMCKPADVGIVKWYFSYYYKETPYLTYKSGTTGKAYVITVSVVASTVNDLPKKGNGTLTNNLSEIDKMVETLVIK